MGTGGKVAVTIICVVVFFFLGIIMLEAGSSNFFVGMIALGLFYGIRAMFKGEKEGEDGKSQEIVLDKSAQPENTGTTVSSQ